MESAIVVVIKGCPSSSITVVVGSAKGMLRDDLWQSNEGSWGLTKAGCIESGFSPEPSMSLQKVTPGAKAPDEFNVIIEIPMNADPIKYEVDKESGALFVDRFMGTAMHYPCNYGYVPHTIADDGDPVDVLVITPFPLVHGVVVRCRPLGIL